MASKSRDIEVYGFFFLAEQMHSWATVPPEYSGGTVCQLSLETSEFCRKYKLNIPRVSKWFPVQFYMYFQDFLSFLLYGWSAKQEHLATSGRNVVWEWYFCCPAAPYPPCAPLSWTSYDYINESGYSRMSEWEWESHHIDLRVKYRVKGQ